MKSFRPIQEGVQHGPYVPTEDPYEQTDQHRQAVGEAEYTKTSQDIEQLNAGLDTQEEMVKNALNNGDFDQLGIKAGPVAAEEAAKAADEFERHFGEGSSIG